MIRAVAFDLDGTLVDSRLDLAAAINGLRQELGWPPLPLDEVVARVGHGARNLVRRSLPAEIEGEPFERAFRRFGERYLAACLDSTVPYPGMAPLLAELTAAGLPLAVITNKPEAPTRKILAGLGWENAFRVVLGGDSLPVRKPDAEPLLEAARRLGVEPGELALVGDSAVDAATAQAAGAPFVLVPWGFGVAQELAPFSPWRTVGSAREIASALLGARDDGARGIAAATHPPSPAPASKGSLRS